MTTPHTTPTGTADVPSQVFKKFFEALETSDVSVEVITKLKNIMGNQTITDAALKSAVLGEELIS